jgi:hypothetical protein
MFFTFLFNKGASRLPKSSLSLSLLPSVLLSCTLLLTSACSTFLPSTIDQERIETEQSSAKFKALDTIKKSFAAYINEDTNALSAYYHPDSNLLTSSKDSVERYFTENELNGDLVYATFLSSDEHYAYVRVKVVTRDEGPNIRLSRYERDILFVLKPHGEQYLIWLFRTLNKPTLNDTQI